MTWKPKSEKKFIRFVLRFKRFKAEDSIVIFSSPRGGSTWLMQSMGKTPRTIINWEPFHPDHGIIPKGENWGRFPFLPADVINDRYREVFDEMLSMKRNSLWTLEFAEGILFKTRVITKFVRANALLPWILQNFKFKSMPIYLLRHPIATCLSQLKAFGNDNPLMNSDSVHEWDTYCVFSQHQDYIRSFESKLSQRVAIWCIQNKIATESREVQRGCLWVFYEDLVQNPELEMSRILVNYGYKPEPIIKKIRFRKRSRTDFKKEFKKDPEEQLNKTFEGLDQNELREIQGIFDYFKMKIYNTQSIFPNKSILSHSN